MARLQHGFSLVEAIVALSVTSLLLAGLYSVFGVVARTNTSAAIVQRDTEDRRLAMNALRTLIANAVPLTERRNERALVLFEGDRTSVRFVTHLPAHAGGGGLQFVEIRTEDQWPGERRRSLTLKFRAASPSVPFDTPRTDQNWSSERLLEDVERVELEYFGSDDDRSAPSWRDSWRAGESLPKLIRVSVAANQAWPDLVVPLRAEVSEAMPYWHRDIEQVR
jgi:prepilin-type N-terminal cleavage/methylation domain-containing protein